MPQAAPLISALGGWKAVGIAALKIAAVIAMHTETPVIRARADRVRRDKP